MLVGFCEIWPIQWGTSFFNPFPTLYGYRSFKPLYFSGTPTFLLRKPQFIMAKPNLFIGKSACVLVFPEKQHIFHGRNHRVSQVSWWNGMLFTVKPPWVHGLHFGSQTHLQYLDLHGCTGLPDPHQPCDQGGTWWDFDGGFPIWKELSMGFYRHVMWFYGHLMED